MNDAPDAEKLHALVLLLQMRARTTDELAAIWSENDRSRWKDDEIDAARTVLLERGAPVPEQKARVAKPVPRVTYVDDPLWEPFFTSKWKQSCFAIWAAAILMALVLLGLLGLLGSVAR